MSSARPRLRLVPPSPDRTPDRPGPGPVPPAVLRSLDLAVMRRVESLIPGEHLTPQVGGGTDLAMIRPYRPGDASTSNIGSVRVRTPSRLA